MGHNVSCQKNILHSTWTVCIDTPKVNQQAFNSELFKTASTKVFPYPRTRPNRSQSSKSEVLKETYKRPQLTPSFKVSNFGSDNKDSKDDHCNKDVKVDISDKDSTQALNRSESQLTTNENTNVMEEVVSDQSEVIDKLDYHVVVNEEGNDQSKLPNEDDNFVLDSLDKVSLNSASDNLNLTMSLDPYKSTEAVSSINYIETSVPSTVQEQELTKSLSKLNKNCNVCTFFKLGKVKWNELDNDLVTLMILFRRLNKILKEKEKKLISKHNTSDIYQIIKQLRKRNRFSCSIKRKNNQQVIISLRDGWNVYVIEGE